MYEVARGHEFVLFLSVCYLVMYVVQIVPVRMCKMVIEAKHLTATKIKPN